MSPERRVPPFCLRRFLRGRAAKEKPSEREPEFFSPEMGADYRAFWDSMARRREGAYLGVAGHPFGRYANETSLRLQGLPVARFIAEKLSLGPDDEILEVGVGVGRLALFLAPPIRTYHGLDISGRMLFWAARRLSEAGLENVRLHLGDGATLKPFGDGLLDAVFFQAVLIHLDREDVFRCLEETRRVLRPGGRAYFQFYNLLHPGGMAEFLHAVRRAEEQGGKQRGRVQCHTSGEVRALVEAAGLDIDEERSHLGESRQTYAWTPDRDFEHYLIAVARRP